MDKFVACDWKNELPDSMHSAMWQVRPILCEMNGNSNNNRTKTQQFNERAIFINIHTHLDISSCAIRELKKPHIEFLAMQFYFFPLFYSFCGLFSSAVYRVSLFGLWIQLSSNDTRTVHGWIIINLLQSLLIAKRAQTLYWMLCIYLLSTVTFSIYNSKMCVVSVFIFLLLIPYLSFQLFSVSCKIRIFFVVVVVIQYNCNYLLRRQTMRNHIKNKYVIIWNIFGPWWTNVETFPK